MMLNNSKSDHCLPVVPKLLITTPSDSGIFDEIFSDTTSVSENQNKQNPDQTEPKGPKRSQLDDMADNYRQLLRHVGEDPLRQGKKFD